MVTHRIEELEPGSNREPSSPELDGPAARLPTTGPPGFRQGRPLAYDRVVEHRVRFQPSGRSIRVSPQTTLLEAARRAGLPIASGCGARAMCGRCGLQIVEGERHLAPESHREREVKRANRIDTALRLSCKRLLSSDVVVRAPYW